MGMYINYEKYGSDMLGGVVPDNRRNDCVT